MCAVERLLAYTVLFQSAVDGVNMRKPTLEIINIGQDMWEVHLYVGAYLTVVTTCNTTSLIKLVGEYLATEA